jgi:hypothetical protein
MVSHQLFQEGGNLLRGRDRYFQRGPRPVEESDAAHPGKAKPNVEIDTKTGPNCQLPMLNRSYPRRAGMIL